jgi:hypothetical protein
MGRFFGLLVTIGMLLTVQNAVKGIYNTVHNKTEDIEQMVGNGHYLVPTFADEIAQTVGYVVFLVIIGSIMLVVLIIAVSGLLFFISLF